MVVSAKMTKTVVVQVDRLVEHPLYGKRMRRRKRYMAHDETSQCHEGDRVQIIEIAAAEQEQALAHQQGNQAGGRLRIRQAR